MKDAVSILQYAKMKGMHVSTINQKIENGIISPAALIKIPGKKNPKINIKRADMDLEFNDSDAEKAGYELNQPESDPLDTQPGEEPRHALIEKSIARYRNVKISTEELKSRKLELEIQEREGRLLDVEDVRKRITTLVGETKDSFLNLPPRMAPLLVSISDPVEMETVLRKELNDVLSNLSRLNGMGGTV